MSIWLWFGAAKKQIQYHSLCLSEHLNTERYLVWGYMLIRPNSEKMCTKKYKTMKETEIQTDKPGGALAMSGFNKQARGGSSGHLQITTRIARSLSSWQIPEITRNMPVHKLLYRSRVLFSSLSLTRTTFPSGLGPKNHGRITTSSSDKQETRLLMWNLSWKA